MPGGAYPVAVPPPTVQYDVDVFWPTFNGYLAGAAFDTAGMIRYGGGTTATAFWGAKVGAGSANMGQFTADGNTGLICGQIFNAANQVHVPSNYSVNLPLLKFGPAGTPGVAWRRIFRLQFALALQSAVAASVAPGTNTNVTFVGFTNNGGAGPTSAGNCYMGFALGTDGTWHWVTRQTAAGFGTVEDVAGIISAANIATLTWVDYVILAANGSNDAQLMVYLNQNYASPIISRNWSAGTTLPGYHSSGAGTSTGFVFLAGAEDTAQNAVVQIGALRWMLGQFTPAGAIL